MADPVTAGIGVFSAGTRLFGGLGKSAAQKTEAKQLEFQAQQHRLRASQIAHSSREQLNESLGALTVSRASRNVSGGSRSRFIQRNTVRRRAKTNENSAILGEKFQEQRLLSSAASRRRAAPFSIASGVTGALNTGLGAFSAITGP